LAHHILAFINFFVVRYDRDKKNSGGVDFVAGFMLGGVVLGTLGYLLAPQVIVYHAGVR
jgi:hypothetical protein